MVEEAAEMIHSEVMVTLRVSDILLVFYDLEVTAHILYYHYVDAAQLVEELYCMDY